MSVEKQKEEVVKKAPMKGIRPYYTFQYPTLNEWPIEFEWYGIWKPFQSKKTIESLHKRIRIFYEPLEVSTQSPVPLGVSLSAFSLTIDKIPIERWYQASKVMEHGGPFKELINKSSKDAKHYTHQKELGNVTHYVYDEREFPLGPGLYDYIYYKGVLELLKDKSAQEREEFKKELLSYEAFTDIFYNPKESFNTQARSIAIVRGFLSMGELPTPEEFLEEYDKLEFVLAEKVDWKPDTIKKDKVIKDLY